MKKIIAMLLLTVSYNASAALITYNGYTLDDTTDIVIGGGLEWLQWDVTDGQSINQALGVYASDGWRLASNIDMAELFTAFELGGSDFIWDASENTTQSSTDPYDVVEDPSDPKKAFVTLFGNTYLEFTGASPQEPLEYSGALFGLDLNGDSNYNWAIVQDDYINRNGGYNRNYVELRADNIPTNYLSNALGVALVRDTQVAQVPEPAHASLFILGLLMIIFRFRNTKRYLNAPNAYPA